VLIAAVHGNDKKLHGRTHPTASAGSSSSNAPGRVDLPPTSVISDHHAYSDDRRLSTGCFLRPYSCQYFCVSRLCYTHTHTRAQGVVCMLAALYTHTHTARVISPDASWPSITAQCSAAFKRRHDRTLPPLPASTIYRPPVRRSRINAPPPPPPRHKLNTTVLPISLQPLPREFWRAFYMFIKYISIHTRKNRQ